MDEEAGAQVASQAVKTDDPDWLGFPAARGGHAGHVILSVGHQALQRDSGTPPLGLSVKNTITVLAHKKDNLIDHNLTEVPPRITTGYEKYIEGLTHSSGKDQTAF